MCVITFSRKIALTTRLFLLRVEWFETQEIRRFLLSLATNPEALWFSIWPGFDKVGGRVGNMLTPYHSRVKIAEMWSHWPLISSIWFFLKKTRFYLLVKKICSIDSSPKWLNLYRLIFQWKYVIYKVSRQ